jgi:hypothetical protein
MPGIEGPVRRDVENGAVYDYSAVATYQPSQQAPPVTIVVKADRLFPDTQNPPDVPGEKEVDNT